MTPKQIELVQESFSRIVPMRADAADLFYRRLFEINPAFRGLFKGDMGEQGKMLMANLSLAVGGLDKLDKILPAVRDLAVRHVKYGVRPEDYQAVGEALIWTLEKGLGGAFTDEVRGAWIDLYTMLSAVMIEPAYGSPAAGVSAA